MNVVNCKTTLMYFTIYCMNEAVDNDEEALLHATEAEAAESAAGTGERRAHGVAMEPPLQLGGEQLLCLGRVAGVEHLVQAQHQELATLLLRLSDFLEP